MLIVQERIGADRPEEAGVGREIAQARRAVLIVNTHSRSGARAYSQAKKLLLEAGVELEATHPVRHAERLPQLVRDEVGKGRKFIIVGGGDGSIAAAADVLAGKDVALGVLPLGTANSFARSLGIPLDLPGAIDVLAGGKIARVDLGRIGDAYFANNCSIGLPANVGRSTPPPLKRWFGRGAYALVAAREWLRYKPFRCTITIAGQRHVFDALDVRVGSGNYQGGVLMAPDANPDDGLISVHVLKGNATWGAARKWACFAAGLRCKPGDVSEMEATEMHIETDPRQHVAVDGEVTTMTPVTISVARGALLVRVPQEFEPLHRRYWR